MERYVFEISRQMAARGHEVVALCRTADTGAATQVGVKTIVLQPKSAKRGWHDRVVFAKAVSHFFHESPKDRNFDIVHSHENTSEQDVSTEHGPCTLAGLRRAPWKFFDYSALRNLMLERAKFGSRSLSAVASCSSQVEKTVLDAYPLLSAKIRAVIPPSYSYLRPTHAKTTSGFSLGFIGADWKRKGLPKALKIFRKLRARDARWTMVVAGFEKARLPKNIISSFPQGVSVAGRKDAKDLFRDIDVLVHPAHDEPFGMVISEALSSGVPTVISERCGCVRHLQAEGLKVLNLEKSVEDWVSACSELRGKNARLIFTRTWDDVAADHEKLYERVLSSR